MKEIIKETLEQLNINKIKYNVYTIYNEFKRHNRSIGLYKIKNNRLLKPLINNKKF